VQRGQPGYREWGLAMIAAGHCSCDGCGGHLVDDYCEACGCGHHEQGPSRHDPQHYAAWIPAAERGRCAHADAVRDERERERERQAQRRRDG